MSITPISSLDVAQPVIDSNYESTILSYNNIKLPSIFMQSFSIDKNQAKCINCNAVFELETNGIIFHMMICTGLMAQELIILPRFKLNCLLCNFITTDISVWKYHLFKHCHVENCFNSHDTTSYSYNCTLCKTHMYGFENSILQHKCKPKALSKLSELLACVYKNFNIHHRSKWFYCADCSHYTLDITNLHIDKQCKAAKYSFSFECSSCMITFYDSCQNSYLYHKISSEHIVLSCLNSKITSQLITSVFPRLPLYITKYFIKCSALQRCYCIICHEIFDSSYVHIYNHHKECISSKCISSLRRVHISLKSINCNICDVQHSSLKKKDIYKTWVAHIISYEHLNNMTAISKEKFKLYSYYCNFSKTIFYGSEDFIKEQILSKNNAVGRLLYVPEIMAQVYNQLNTLFASKYLFCCGICDEYSSNKYCKHKNIESVITHRCIYCRIVFNVKSDFEEHILSNEHIILNYFNFYDQGEVVYTENLTKPINLDKASTNGSILVPPIKSDYELCIATSQSMQIDDKLFQANSGCTNMLETEKKLAYCDSKVIILNLIDTLLVQPKKSSLNNYLRTNLELLNNMSQTTNDFVNLKNFFCATCDLVFRGEESWTQHDKSFHSETKDHIFFYCAICQIYYISTSNDINHHISRSIEHSVMTRFHKYMKQNKDNNNSIIKNNNNVSTVTDKFTNLVLKFLNENDQHQNAIKNETICLEITDVNTKLKNNNYYLLKKLLQEKYGNFKQISSRIESFIVFFDYINQIGDIYNDSKELTELYGFSIKMITQNKDNPLSLETQNLFCDWKMLNHNIELELTAFELISTSPSIQNKINTLCSSLRNLKNILELDTSLDVYVFGSRIYGLANSESDVDLYIDIGHTFYGDMANDIDKQVYLVNLFAEKFLLRSKEFKNVKEICDARVPIIKFYHEPTQLYCDISFKSGMGVRNTKLIRLYLSMNNTVKWMVCVFKKWALQNNLKDKHLFTSYGLIWLVLFYLIAENIVPPLELLVQHTYSDKKEYIEGWNCMVGKWFGNTLNGPHYNLLLNFFKFYSNINLFKENVLCTSTGKVLEKKFFFNKFGQLPAAKDTKFKDFKSKIAVNFSLFCGLVLQDPFDLSFNITKNITINRLTNFCEMCDKTVTILLNIKNDPLQDTTQ